MEKETKVKNTSDVLKIGADEDVKDDVLGDVKQTVEVSADKKVYAKCRPTSVPHHLSFFLAHIISSLSFYLSLSHLELSFGLE
tara:strand:+ start:1332 stop:1580 length:249 start_codon:yes stop_codon:yes gene_type:complete